MKHTVHKYTLNGEMTVLNMPVGAKILTVREQRGSACIWALVDLTKASQPRTFVMYGTGYPMPDPAGLQFVDSVMFFGGDIVFHVFEVKQ
jgi:hypothetical protein